MKIKPLMINKAEAVISSTNKKQLTILLRVIILNISNGKKTKRRLSQDRNGKTEIISIVNTQKLIRIVMKTRKNQRLSYRLTTQLTTY